MLFRNHRLVRAVACFLLIETVGLIAEPPVALAMMGTGQPEFTSYEAAGSTDMVNLSTGDLSYSVPVLDIPGPERSFSLPLSYKAGIQLEQEASWVGLGWSLNAGAIVRNLNGYPDDAKNEASVATYKKAIERGWTGGVPGILELGWNSNTGHHGSVDLLGLASVSWDNEGINGGDLVGVGFKAGEGFSVNPVRMAMAAVTIATLGAGSSLSVAANIGIQAAASLAMGIGMSYLGRQGGVSGFMNQPTVSREHHFLSTDYWVFFDQDQTERMYGSLYFGAMGKDQPNFSNDQYSRSPYIFPNATTTTSFKAQPFNNNRNCGSSGTTISETASDIYQLARPEDNSYYETSMRPISVAHDNFNVMGESVSGSIRPYRLDVGSVAYPKIGVENCDRHYKYNVVPFLDDYKVGFRYENTTSNGYDYHHYSPTTGHEPEGIDHNAAQGTLRIVDPSLQLGNSVVNINPTASNPLTNNNLATRTAGVRKGLHNTPATNAAIADADRRFIQGKNVQWYSNQEIRNMAVAGTTGNGFMECNQPGSTTNGFSRFSLPGHHIGAFSVTGEDGTTYHYSLPVYQYKTYSESLEINVPSGTGDPGKSTQVTGRDAGYVTTWLLTAITSADYFDHNNNGTVDDGDWGGWVRMEYGKFSSRYKWRQPYIGKSYGDENPVKSANFSEGYKDTYYLNAIKTRTHTALFIKSARQDGRGHFTAQGTPTRLGIIETKPATSLRLDEIILLDNKTYAQLKDGFTTGAPGFSENTDSNASINDRELPNNADESFANVFDSYDLALDDGGQMREFVADRALKRIKFNYGYDLCRGTPNSFEYHYSSPNSFPAMADASNFPGRGGKLTLKSVSIFGPQNTKIIPDFSFDYENNPAYGKEKWDGFGMYNAMGDNNSTSHAPSTSNTDGAAWSLTRITNPLGGKTEITYERDQYAHVSEHGAKRIRLYNSNCSTQLSVRSPSTSRDFTGLLSDFLQPPCQIILNGRANYTICHPRQNGTTVNSVNLYTDHVYDNEVVTVTSLNPFTIAQAPAYNQPVLPYEYRNYGIDYEGGIVPRGMDVEAVLPGNVYGGDIRVAGITTLDENNHAYQVRYQYTNSLPSDRNSTGVIAKEPDFLNRFKHALYGMFDYPATPVLYSQVRVLRGTFATGTNDYDQREEYEFFTPSSQMVVESTIGNGTRYYGGFQNPANNYANSQVERRTNYTQVDIGKIGQPKAIRKYNRRGQLELSTTLGYTSNLANPEQIGGQGQYTEGVLSTEMLDYTFYRINRSTKKYFPSVMAGSVSTRNGVTITSDNVLYDFYTGQVLETKAVNSRQETYYTRNFPAYTLAPYASMGAAGDNANNSNMLAQLASSYVIKEKHGATINPLTPFTPGTSSLVAASVQTWKNTWNNYRIFNSANTRYEDDPALAQPVWRQEGAYVWQSSLLNPDGTYARFVDFDWANPVASAQHQSWMKTGEVVRYDHFSHSLETKDVNGIYSSQKTGFNQSQTIAAAANCRYGELAYSGAEDVGPDEFQYLWGGDVYLGSHGNNFDNTYTSAFKHTGNNSLRVGPESEGFRYTALVGAGTSSDLMIGKKYRVSAWVHLSDAGMQDAVIRAAIGGTQLGQAEVSSTQTKKAGDWYRLSLTITIPSTANGVSTFNQPVIFQCANENTYSDVYFDDFRVCPEAATMSSRVFDLHTGQLTYVLNDENLYTRYDYDNAGKLVRVYREVLDQPGDNSPTARLVKESTYNYAIMTAPTWVSYDYRCVLDANGNNTGVEERHVRNVNNLTRPSVSDKWEVNGGSPNCLIPYCPNYYTTPNNGNGGAGNFTYTTILSRPYMNGCEYAVDYGWDCESMDYGSGPAEYRQRHHWYWTRTQEHEYTDTNYATLQEGCAPRRSTTTHSPEHVSFPKPTSKK